MQRRQFLKALSAAFIVGGFSSRAFAELVTPCTGGPDGVDARIQDYLDKMRHFNQTHVGDVYVEPDQRHLLEVTVRRLRRVERLGGYGFFNLLSLDEACSLGRNMSDIGEFSKAELDYLEAVFYQDAKRYGFLGERSLTKITDCIPKDDVIKIAGSGHYLYKGAPLATYTKVKNDVGERAVLTSGVRGVMKQFLLFLGKAYENGGNLSLASRSLAPPGYSFHGISDFDIGQIGFGKQNFTERFVTTDVCRRLMHLEYIDLRYPRDNLLGVRFEPWHIKVNAKA
jgi:D-alanyl-D-alanine carboxypeptidase